MKIFLLKKKYVFKISLMLTILILISLFFIHIVKNITAEISCNSQISNDLMSKIMNSSNDNEKIAYLTFDDGPTTSVTPKILDILKAENIKASFFVIGKSVKAHPEIVKRAYDEGHYIANHTYTHNNSSLYKNSDSFINEIKQTDLAIGKAIGIENYSSYIFRFPNGFMAPMYKNEKEKAVSSLLEINYTYIDWNCLNNDSMKKYTNEQLLNNLKQSCQNKNTVVILMHDTKDVSDSSLVLQDSILYLKSKGYIFKNFYELI